MLSFRSSMSRTVDVVSDFVCPWCYIGTRRLDDVLAKRGVDARVTYHPFLLDSSIPIEGVDLRERLRRKYGRDPETMFARVEAAAKDAGVSLDFAKVRRYPSTLRAHALVARAVDKGTQRALARAMFEAYFGEGKDLGALDVLADLGERHGFSRDEATAIASDDDQLAEVRAAAADAAAQGIDGVPFFVFDERVAFSGAQPVEVFERALAAAQ